MNLNQIKNFLDAFEPNKPESRQEFANTAPDIMKEMLEELQTKQTITFEKANDLVEELCSAISKSSGEFNQIFDDMGQLTKQKVKAQMLSVILGALHGEE